MSHSQILIEMLEAIQAQKEKLLLIGAKKVTPFTEEELYQPFDFPELTRDLEFNYEEGVYHGQMEMLTLVRRVISESAGLS